MTKDELLKEVRKELDLGHAQREEAVLRQLSLATSAPGAPFTVAASVRDKDGINDLTSLYRFAANDKIDLNDLRDCRRNVVLSRFNPTNWILLINDMSVLDYSFHESKWDRRAIGDGDGEGYEYIPTPAVDFASGRVLGVLHDTLVNAAGPDDEKAVDYDYEPLFHKFSPAEQKRLRENHRHQMAARVTQLAPVPAGKKTIHVADREFDDHYILDACIETKQDYVIRSSALRNVPAPETDWLPESARTGKQAGHPCPPGRHWVNMEGLAAAVPSVPYKTLDLDRRGRVVQEGATRARTARLSIGACPVMLYRMAKRNKKYMKPRRTVTVNMVVIREIEPPPDVEQIFWVLFTSPACDTFAEQCLAGAIYEMRWAVEEFFRLLKSGYQVEKLKVDCAARLARLMVILTPAAMVVPAVKREAGIGPGGAPADEQYRQVKKAVREPDNPGIPLPLRTFAMIARLGGWPARRRDPIGPTILMRGVPAYQLMPGAMDELGPLLLEIRQSRMGGGEKNRV